MRVGLTPNGMTFWEVMDVLLEDATAHDTMPHEADWTLAEALEIVRQKYCPTMTEEEMQAIFDHGVQAGYLIYSKEG